MEDIHFDVQACLLRVKGRNIRENEYVKVRRGILGGTDQDLNDVVCHSGSNTFSPNSLHWSRSFTTTTAPFRGAIPDVYCLLLVPSGAHPKLTYGRLFHGQSIRQLKSNVVNGDLKHELKHYCFRLMSEKQH